MTGDGTRIEDARFEDGIERPLRLIAGAPEDVEVIAALVQDAVFAITEMRWLPRQRRFALLINRFRWEDRAGAEGRRAPERVRALLVIDSVLGVATQGIDRRESDTILSLLSIDFQPGAEGAGRLTLLLAGDGAVALDVECIDLRLDDVTRPYRAPSGEVPRHD